MASIFIQVSHDPETAGPLAQRGFLVAAAAAEEGHQVSVFLAGGAVRLLTEGQLARDAFGVPLRTHVDTLLSHHGEIFVSEMAVGARGLTAADLIDRAVLTSHRKIVELLLSCDRSLSYG